jgi:hypothetical protein
MVKTKTEGTLAPSSSFSSEEFDHIFDWESTVELRARNAPIVGSGLRCWISPYHKLKSRCGNADFRIDTENEPNRIKSILSPRIRDQRFLIKRQEPVSTHQFFDKFSNSTSNIGESNDSLLSENQPERLPFFSTKTISLRRHDEISCSHCPRFGSNVLSSPKDRIFEDVEKSNTHKVNDCFREKKIEVRNVTISCRS